MTSMKRASLMALLLGVPLVALIAWVASHTYWVDAKVPMPLKGEALTNPFYAAQRFAEALGARTARSRVLTIPPTDSVIVLSAWHWNLTTSRREALERWVESGGRLVVDATLTGGEDEFERWSGIVREYPDVDEAEESEASEASEVSEDDEKCGELEEELDGRHSIESPATRYSICHLDGLSVLKSDRNAVWALRDESGIQAIRVQVGRGSVTAINGHPFRYRTMLDGDHGWLLVAATQMRKGDHVRFLTEEDHPSLLALLWQHAAPVVVLALALVACALWRGGVRFGPLMAPPDRARRSLAEQIRGTGQFALRHGSGDALHAACVRALDETARRRVSSYARLSAGERTAALAKRTGLNRDALAAARLHAGVRRSQRLRNAIALVETARRRILEREGS